jgi:hypothetical protein
MQGRWNITGIPHKGWVLIDVIDIREDGQSEDETDYESCMMCGNEKIRYVHIVQHPDITEEFRVGCVCAEKMTDDYTNPKQKENELKNKNNRRVGWLKRKWKISNKGGHSIKIDGNSVGIFNDKRNPAKYKCRINDNFGSILYDTPELAKLGLFKKIEDLKVKGKWEEK